MLIEINMKKKEKEIVCDNINVDHKNMKIFFENIEMKI